MAAKRLWTLLLLGTSSETSNMNNCSNSCGCESNHKEGSEPLIVKSLTPIGNEKPYGFGVYTEKHIQNVNDLRDVHNALNRLVDGNKKDGIIVKEYIHKMNETYSKIISDNIRLRNHLSELNNSIFLLNRVSSNFKFNS